MDFKNIQPTNSAGEQLTLVDYWHIIRKRSRLAVTFLVISIVSTTFYSLLHPKIYKATTRVLIERGEKNILAIQDIFSVQTAGLDYYPTQYKILKSRSVAKKVLDHHNLWQQYASKDPIETFLRHVEVEPIKQSRLVDVSAFSTNPQQSADLANAVVHFYIEQNLENKLAMTQGASAWLEQKIEDVRKKLAESETLMQNFKEKNQDVDFIALEASERYISNLQSELSKLQTQMSDLNERYLPKNPKVIRAKARFTSLKKHLSEELNRSVAVGRVGIEYNQLKREVESNRKLYSNMLARLKETLASEGMGDTNVIVVDKAETPKEPVAPRVLLNIFLSLLVGAFGGSGLCLMMESLDNTIKTPEDVESLMPLLGVIMKWQNVSGNELIVESEPDSAIAESFRAIRTSLLFSNPDKPQRVILITSPNPEEGKTLVASNLAASIAQSGARVLLIDADLRRPRAHKVFQQNATQGLSHALTHTAKTGQFIVETQVDHLFALFCGAIPPKPSEMLGSERMRELLKQLKEEFDYILIDSPPFLSVTDAVVLSTMVDGVAIVTRYNKTAKKALAQGRQKFMEVKANLLGAIINGMDLNQEGYRYTGYSSYHQNEKDVLSTLDVSDVKSSL